MRHKEPDYITAWKWGEELRCCHTCLHYDDKGICFIAAEEPPEDFTSQHKQCDYWVPYDNIPF